jgi:hypothetical protein
MSRLNVALSSGCVTCALLMRRPACARARRGRVLEGLATAVGAAHRARGRGHGRPPLLLLLLLLHVLHTCTRRMHNNTVKHTHARPPVGRMKRSYFGGLRVKPGPTNVTCAAACGSKKAHGRDDQHTRHDTTTAPPGHTTTPHPLHVRGHADPPCLTHHTLTPL